VSDPGTGIQFHAATSDALVAALERGVALVRDAKKLAATRRAAMARDSSWTASAREYAELYRSLA
jgi:starch synthase